MKNNKVESIYSKLMDKLIGGGHLGNVVTDKDGMVQGWSKYSSWLESNLQPYLLSLGHVLDWVYNEKGMKTLVNPLVGVVTEINQHELRSITGYYFSDVDVNDNEVNRIRKLLHKTREFQESDIFKELYALADSDTASPIWLNLENCQQNRAKVVQNYCNSIELRVNNRCKN